MESPSAIRVTELRKSYKEHLSWKSRAALKGVSFEVPSGQIFGFLGANGAGKTTLIKILLGLQAADSGAVELLGNPGEHVQTRARIGFLPERPYFQLNLTAGEFLDFHRGLYGAPLPGKRRPENDELLRIVGLGDVKRQLLRGFSKGMLQRIGLAQALLNDPDLLILDEPMSGLDPVGRREVRNLLLELNQAGKTIFFSSHILSDIESLCQRIAVLEKGELKYCGRIDELLHRGGNEYELVFRIRDASRSEEAARLGNLKVSGEHLRLIVAGPAEAREAALALWGMGAEISSFNRVQRNLEEVLFGEGEGRR
jgi:ABC-2 type transport system ATP-binding protein